MDTLNPSESLRRQPPLALSVALSRFTSRVGGGYLSRFRHYVASTICRSYQYGVCSFRSGLRPNVHTRERVAPFRECRRARLKSNVRPRFLVVSRVVDPFYLQTRRCTHTR